MTVPATYNIIAVLKHLVKMFAELAKTEKIRVRLISVPAKVLTSQKAEPLVKALSEFLHQLIRILPENTDVQISIQPKEIENERFIRIIVVNTGICLSNVSQLKNHLNFTVKELPCGERGTSFETNFRITEKPGVEVEQLVGPRVNHFPEFYLQIRKRLLVHLSKADQLVANLSITDPREAAFLRRINTLIFENIDNPQMDANFISDALHMSRTQVFRRLKRLVRQAPGHYITTLKLEKAKELFQTTDLRINEVAFRTGFESPGNFTKAFVRHFGIKPSLFCGKKMQQMAK